MLSFCQNIFLYELSRQTVFKCYDKLCVILMYDIILLFMLLRSLFGWNIVLRRDAVQTRYYITFRHIYMAYYGYMWWSHMINCLCFVPFYFLIIICSSFFSYSFVMYRRSGARLNWVGGCADNNITLSVIAWPTPFSYSFFLILSSLLCPMLNFLPLVCYVLCSTFSLLFSRLYKLVS